MADDAKAFGVSEDPGILPVDVGQLGPWLDGSRPVSELLTELPVFKSEDDAVAFLDQVRRGLADIEAGRVYTTEEVMRQLESRRRARRAAA